MSPFGANGVVAGGIPIAVGAAQGLKMQKSDAIVTCMFGDGAINRGPFLEGLNWAVLFNTDGGRKLLVDTIDPLVHGAADKVKEWPRRDLFEK